MITTMSRVSVTTSRGPEASPIWTIMVIFYLQGKIPLKPEGIKQR